LANQFVCDFLGDIVKSNTMKQEVEHKFVDQQFNDEVI